MSKILHIMHLKTMYQYKKKNFKYRNTEISKNSEICKIKLCILDLLNIINTCSLPTLPSYFFLLFRKNMQMHILINNMYTYKYIN